jgi:hypothetical protein
MTFSAGLAGATRPLAQRTDFLGRDMASKEMSSNTWIRECNSFCKKLLLPLLVRCLNA